MSLATILLMALLTTPLSASTSNPNAGLFIVTSFLNSGSPHSTEARLSFTLSSTCPIAPLTNITCAYGQSVQPTIATTYQEILCADSAVFFTFDYNTPGNGYYLSVTHLSNENKTVDTGVLYMGDNVTTVIDEFNPNAEFEMLVHREEFEIGYNRVEG